jgi:hypothetical protein
LTIAGSPGFIDPGMHRSDRVLDTVTFIVATNGELPVGETESAYQYSSPRGDIVGFQSTQASVKKT